MKQLTFCSLHAMLLLLSFGVLHIGATLEPEKEPAEHARLMRRESPSEEEEQGDDATLGRVCSKPPCCPPADCVFPFSHAGNTYANCTAEGFELGGVDAFWCGKETLMREDSRWDFCMPMPKGGSCPDTSNSVLEEKRKRAAESNKRRMSLSRRGDDTPLAPECVDQPFTEEESEKNRGAWSCTALSKLDPLFCETDQVFAKTRCPDTCGECLQLAVKQGCSAPENIKGAEAPACLEGAEIHANHWCTPKCVVGKLSWVNTSGLLPNWACYGSNSDSRPQLWGYNLCCSGGVLSPDTFRCANDLFTAMDTNNNGVVSRAEFDKYPSETWVELNEQIEEATEEMDAVLDKTYGQGNHTKGKKTPKNSFVADFVVCISLVLMAIACILITWTLKRNGMLGARKKPQQKAEEVYEELPEEDPIPTTLAVAISEYAVQKLGPDINGLYMIHKKKEVNGKTLWKKITFEPKDDETVTLPSDGDEETTNYYLFSSLEGHWVFGIDPPGAEGVKGLEFNCNITSTGVIFRTTEPFAGRAPNNPDLQWEVMVEGQWFPDEDMSVTSWNKEDATKETETQETETKDATPATSKILSTTSEKSKLTKEATPETSKETKEETPETSKKLSTTSDQSKKSSPEEAEKST